MAELTGQAVPEQVNGISLLPSLKGDTKIQKKHAYLYWEFTGGQNQIIVKTALRKADWKLLQFYRKGNVLRSELYNLKDDPGEATDLAGKQPELVKELKSLMTEAHKPLPSIKDLSK